LAATTNPRATLRAACVASYRSLTRAFFSEDAEQWLALDLTMSQLKAMTALGLHGPLAVGGLGRSLGISEPAASLLVDQLEREGLVRREQDPADRRRILVTPVPEALERVEGLRHGRTERVLDWLDRLADDDLRALARGLGALDDVAQEAARPEPATEGNRP